MRQYTGRLVFLTLFLIGSSLSNLSGCAVFRATGRSVEAVGEGAGHAVAGTGRAVEGAARETKHDLTGR